MENPPVQINVNKCLPHPPAGEPKAFDPPRYYTNYSEELFEDKLRRNRLRMANILPRNSKIVDMRTFD